ncbi:LLM class flavin-dependent oxidoreductase [Pseudoduganella umbonata]|uniref:FMN-dependent oxidoreductase (Nitrilotriacetate monooxygenase family) n=1 Tax=Pseudoduganella umbonata TaxID=864828 RepID=A0A4P8HX54_9BURK|nr:LLM class flavin-dependent oxidoreductase [Pseudoduganella umbonata]MBB3222889.1 FMN-dependent oxidoreductase (nitrilotriacetate monooxygenase family) [Pseudoduganella umbonata]QCP13015.1 LLM class flavin-dependent oxidoreductase [Pseudoduganella umbonata]
MAHARTRQLSLTAFLMRYGHHVAAWRHPDTDLASSPYEVYRDVVQSAERACLDAVFLADSVALTGAPSVEPVTLLSALAAVTSRIGLIATATTTYNEPYTVARQFASLDSISNGRAGWNLVTSDNAAEAANFGRERHVDHAVRYARAREFHAVVDGLWQGWEEGAFVNDKAGGRLLDASKVRRLDYRGEHFSVSGPLNVPPSPQGKPVVVQAGSSETGRELAAATADVVFTAQATLADAQVFYRDMKERVARHGRAPDSLRVTPGIFAIVGTSEQEAQDKFGLLQSLIEPAAGLALLGRMIGNFDLSGYPLDGPLPDLPVTQDGQRSRQQLLTAIAQGEDLTIRQLYQRIAGGRGHFTVIGTAEQVADQMQAWFEGGAADGFNLMPPTLPGGLDDVLRLVVPELQRRGLFRTRYEGTTLRSHLGLQEAGHRDAL